MNVNKIVLFVVVWATFIAIWYIYNKERVLQERAKIKKVDYEKYKERINQIRNGISDSAIKLVSSGDNNSDELKASLEKWAKKNKDYSTGASIITAIGGIVSMIPVVGSIIGGVMVVAGGAMSIDAENGKKDLQSTTNLIL